MKRLRGFLIHTNSPFKNEIILTDRYLKKLTYRIVGGDHIILFIRKLKDNGNDRDYSKGIYEKEYFDKYFIAYETLKVPWWVYDFKDIYD